MKGQRDWWLTASWLWIALLGCALLTLIVTLMGVWKLLIVLAAVVVIVVTFTAFVIVSDSLGRYRR